MRRTLGPAAAAGLLAACGGGSGASLELHLSGFPLLFHVAPDGTTYVTQGSFLGRIVP
jgi:hypothetical protein